MSRASAIARAVRGGVFCSQQVLGVVEEAMGEMVRGAVLAQAGDSRREECRGIATTAAVGQAGAG